MAESEYLLLKWGSLKGWHVHTDESFAALQKYASFGMSMSAAMQHDSVEQRQALCDLIDTIKDGVITNDWNGKTMTKEEAKNYVMKYSLE